MSFLAQLYDALHDVLPGILVVATVGFACFIVVERPPIQTCLLPGGIILVSWLILTIAG
jgi:hypothetical protein